MIYFMKEKIFITLVLSTISLLFSQAAQAQCHTTDSFIVQNIDTVGSKVTAKIKFYYSRVSSGQTSTQIHYASSVNGPWTLIDCYNLTGVNGTSDSVITTNFTYNIDQPLYSKITLWKNGQCGGSQCSSAQVIPPTAPLPVTLLSFNVRKKESVVELTWSTAKEQDNKGFEIERSTDGKNWDNIGFVNSLSQAGNSNNRLDYVFTDLYPVAGKNMYRLKQVNYSGSFEYTEVRTMIADSKSGKINVYPNPVKDKLNISGLKANETVKLFDMTGRVVWQAEAKGMELTIPVSNITEGVYHLNVTGTYGAASSHKIIKIN